MKSLGLDPSLRAYGWCVYDSEASRQKDRLVASGHEGTLSSTVPVARFVHFRALVKDLLKRFRVGVVGIESPAYDAGPFQSIHFGLMMYSLEAVFERRLDCVLFDPATVKLLVGRGNATKQDVQRYVQADRMCPDPVQADEADAYCIAKFATRFSELQAGAVSPDELSLRERAVFLERRRKKKGLDGSVSFRRSAHVFRENSRFFRFSQVPPGNVELPQKSAIRPELLRWLEEGAGKL
jgi:Holliday junction resolvasome RuvABC endonuclease subunit